MQKISRRMEMIHPTIGWRRDEHGTLKHERGSWILCSVSRFSSKQCIPCPALRHGCLTLLYVTSIQNFFCPWNNRARLY